MTEVISAQSEAINTSSARAAYLGGIALLLAGTICFSSAGFYVRAIGRDSETLLFWRGIFTAFAIIGFIWWRSGRSASKTIAEFHGMGLPGYWVAVLSTASMACFVASLQYTSVANNSFIFGIGPFMIAGLAWMMIAERPSATTLACATIALLGAGLVLGSSLQLSGSRLIGDGLAVLMTLSFAVKTVLVRQHRGRSMIAAGCVGALIGTAGALLFGPDYAISWREVGLFALFGFTQQGAGLILTTLGIARVPAAHAALIMTLDLPLAPLWVWLAFGEAPTVMGLAGGLIVLAAIFGHILIEGRRLAKP